MTGHSMTHFGRGWLKALALLASALLVWSALATTATAASFKPYELINVPRPLAPSGAVTVTVKNDAGTQQLGSIEIGVPSGITIAPAIGSGGTSLSSTLILFQNLNLANLKSKDLSFTVTTPCTAGSFTWNFQAQQANQWQSGNGANYLTLAKVTYDDGSTPVGDLTSKVPQPSTAFANPCRYDLSGIPGPGILTGGGNAVSIGVLNASAGRTLASVTIGVSPGYSISSLSGNGTSVAFTVNLPPGGSTTLAFTVNAPCAGNLTWSFTPSPAFVLRNLNGSSYAGGPIVSTLANPACTLKFIAPTSGPAVADAEVSSGPAQNPDTRILSAGTPGSGSFQVGLYDLSGIQSPAHLVPVAQKVTLSIGSGPPGASLSPAAPQATTSGGIATFAGVTESAFGIGVTLHATSENSTPGDSNPFNVVAILQPCDATQLSCNVTFAPNTGSTNSITASSPELGNYFAGGSNIAGATLSCAFDPFKYSDTYDPNTTYFYYTGDGTKTGTISIDKATVQITANNGVSFYRVCYGAPTTFNTGRVTGYGATGAPAAGGTYAVPIPANFVSGVPYPTTDPRSAGNNLTDFFGQTWYVGTLPFCLNVGNVAPCHVATTSLNGGRVLTFNLAPGDPFNR